MMCRAGVAAGDYEVGFDTQRFSWTGTLTRYSSSPISVGETASSWLPVSAVMSPEREKVMPMQRRFTLTSLKPFSDIRFAHQGPI